MTESDAHAAPTGQKCANKRDAQLESRCQRFVEAAETLFLARGFAGTSVNEIVRVAGGSLTTLYAAFGTKDELFVAVMNRRAATLFADIVNAEAPAADVEAELLGVAKRILNHMLSADALAIFRLAIHEGPKFPSVRDAVLLNGLNEFLQRLEEYFAGLKLAQKLAINDTELAAEHFLTLVQGHMRTRAACGDSDNVTKKQRDNHVKKAVDAFLRIYPAKLPVQQPQRK
ncbi:MAG: TetR/AcrR family transcriptional regulator [Betaproteobacteria bacterium]